VGAGAVDTTVATALPANSTSTSVAPEAVAAGVVLPVLPPIDAGVAVGDVLVGGVYEWDAIVADLDAALDDSAPLTVAFTGCHLRAPGEWVLSGTAHMQVGTGPVHVGAAIETIVEGDMLYSYPFRFSITGTGDFSIIVDGIAAQRGPGQEQRPVLRPLLHDRCTITVTHASIPAAMDSITLEVTRRPEPLEWQAPPQTIQGLGSGVILSDVDDPRIPWAYLTWSEHQFGFETLWLPDLPRVMLTELSSNDNSPCIHAGASLIAENGNPIYYVDNWRDCDLSSWVPSGDRAQSTVPGFDVGENEIGDTVLIAELGGTIVIVSGEDASLRELESVAGSLVPFANLRYQAHDAPGTDGDLDQAIAEALEPLDAAERGRFPLGDGYVVVATYVDNREDGVADVLVASFTVMPSNDRWLVQPASAEGGGDLCLAVNGGGLATADNELASWASWVTAVGAEKTWTIQAMENGEWTDLPTVDGVFFEGSTTEPVATPPPLRAVDKQGRLVRCPSYLPEPAAEWSPWQPPTARNDLTLSVDIAGGLSDGKIVTVTGSGFYLDSSVTVRMCRFETTRWADVWDCAADADDFDEAIQAGFAQVDNAGAFAEEFEVSASFETFLGDDVDCGLERCVIRADGDRGYHQAGWVEVQFGIS